MRILSYDCCKTQQPLIVLIHYFFNPIIRITAINWQYTYISYREVHDNIHKVTYLE